MSIISQAIIKSQKSAYQLFYLAYCVIADGEEQGFEEAVQASYDYWVGGGGIPVAVSGYCHAIMRGEV